jgi:hypothetical protein
VAEKFDPDHASRLENPERLVELPPARLVQLPDSAGDRILMIRVPHHIFDAPAALAQKPAT